MKERMPCPGQYLGVYGFAMWLWQRCGVLAAASFAAAADRALIVGIGDYATVSDLPGIQLDVDMMKEVAEDLGFQNIETLTNQEATYDGFKAGFDRLIADTGAGDRVLIYFSGHGACVADQDGDESDGKDEALVLYDTRGGTMERSLARRRILRPAAATCRPPGSGADRRVSQWYQLQGASI